MGLLALTTENVVQIFRTRGILSGDYIFLKENPVKFVARELAVESEHVVRHFEKMRLDGLLVFRPGRPDNAELHLAEWLKRIQQPAQAMPALPQPAVETPSESQKPSAQPRSEPLPIELFHIPLVSPGKGDDDEERKLQYIETLPTLRPSIEQITSVYARHGRIEGDGIIVKKLIPTIRTLLNVSTRQVETTLKAMEKMGLVVFKDGKVGKAILGYSVWNHRMRKCTDLASCSLAITLDPQGKPKAVDWKREYFAHVIEVLTAPEPEEEQAPESEPVEVPEEESAAPSVPAETIDIPIEPTPEPSEPLVETSEEDEEDYEEDLEEEEETAASIIVPQVPVENPVESAVRSICAYFEVEDEKDPVRSKGFSDLTLRRLAEQFSGASLYEPLARGDADETLRRYESFRDETLSKLRHVDQELTRLRSQKVNPDEELGGYLEILVEDAVTKHLSALQKDVKKFFLEFRQLVKRVRERSAHAQEETERLDRLIAELESHEFDLVSVDSAEVSDAQIEEYRRLLQEGRALRTSITGKLDECRQVFDTIVQRQGSFSSYESRAEVIAKQLSSFRDTITLLGVTLSEGTLGSLEQAEDYLQLSSQKTEAYHLDTSINLPLFTQAIRKLEESEEWLQTFMSSRVKRVVCEREKTGAGWHHPDCPNRTEDLKTLMLVAIAVLVPGPRGKRKGQSLSHYAKRILPRSGLIETREADAAREAGDDIKEHLHYEKDGRTHRFTVTEDGRRVADKALCAMSDPAFVYQALERAYKEETEAFRIRRYAPKTGTSNK